MGFTVVVEKRYVISVVLNWVRKSNESLKFWLWRSIGRESGIPRSCIVRCVGSR